MCLLCPTWPATNPGKFQLLGSLCNFVKSGVIFSFCALYRLQVPHAAFCPPLRATLNAVTQLNSSCPWQDQEKREILSWTSAGGEVGGPLTDGLGGFQYTHGGNDRILDERREMYV